jgi:hypothetical protein
METKSSFLTSVILGVVLCSSNSAMAVNDVLATGPNARITQIDTNWANEGRFAVFVDANTGPCSGGWIHFHTIYLKNQDPGIHKMNYATALSAMLTNRRVQILGNSTNCWEAINIQVF